MIGQLLANHLWPKSIAEPFLITSDPTINYNCIAWAYGVSDRWYWPDANGTYYWPAGIPRVEDIKSFTLLFSAIGYTVCVNGDLEVDFDKIAIYSNFKNTPTHAARQLPNGQWTSKLGESFDVSHSMPSMDGGFYGDATVFMRKPK